MITVRSYSLEVDRLAEFDSVRLFQVRNGKQVLAQRLLRTRGPFQSKESGIHGTVGWEHEEPRTRSRRAFGCLLCATCVKVPYPIVLA
jgi:hypothetical protein